MEKVCCDLTIADMNLRLVSDRPLFIDEGLKPFCSEFETPDVIYSVKSVPDPDALIPPDSERIYNGAGMEVFRSGEKQYHRYYYGGDLALLITDENGDGTDVYVFEHTVNRGIQKFLALETQILKFGGVFLHASLIKYNGAALAFTAPSGTGKSTHAELWRKNMGAVVLNGDRAALRERGGEWFAYGSPWAGSSGIYINESAPLKAIVILKQAPDNSVRRLFGTETFGKVLGGGILPYWNNKLMNEACDVINKLIDEVPVFELRCTPDIGALEVIKEALKDCL